MTPELPAWIRLGPWIIVPLKTALFGVGCAGGAWFFGLRKARGYETAAHWTERARLLFPMRRALAAALLATIIVSAILPSIFEPIFLPTRPGFPSRVLVATCIATGWLSAYIVMVRAVRATTEPALTFRGAFGRTWSWGVARLLHLYTAAILAYLLPTGFTPWAVLALGLEVLVVFIVVTGRHSGLLRLLGFFREMPEEDARALAEAAERSGTKVRASGQLKNRVANALAFQLGRAVWITDKASEVLSHEQKVAVFLHELGHLKDNQRWLNPLMSLVVGVLILLIPIFSPDHFLVLGGISLGVVVVLRLAFRKRHEHEKEADAHVHEHSENAAVYATALERLYEANLVPAVLPGKRLTHPQLYDRMVAAGSPPSYPRPMPPATLRSGPLVAAALVILLTVPNFVSLTAMNPMLRALNVAESGGQSAHAVLWWIGPTQRSPDLAALVPLLREGLDRGEAKWAVQSLAMWGRCDDAELLREAYPFVPGRLTRAGPCAPPGMHEDAVLDQTE